LAERFEGYIYKTILGDHMKMIYWRIKFTIEIILAMAALVAFITFLKLTGGQP